MDEIKEDEKEINEKKKQINNFLEGDKKNILDKSWYELSVIYDKSNENKSQEE